MVLLFSPQIMKSPEAELVRETRKLEAKRGEYLKEKVATSATCYCL